MQPMIPRLGVALAATLLAAILCFLPQPLPAADFVDSEELARLIRNGELDKARAMCIILLDHQDKAVRAGAHTGLFHIEMRDAVRYMARPGSRSNQYVEGYGGPALYRALGHLDQALALSPGELSLHKARLYVLARTRSPLLAVEALRHSIEIYEGPGVPEAWQGAFTHLFNLGSFGQAHDYCRVLAEHYPDDAAVAANMGAVLTMLGRDGEALVYCSRALELAPDDPVGNWNMARLYDFMGKTDLAEKYYRKTIALQGDGLDASYYATYAEFVEKDLRDIKRAETIRRKHCRTP